MFNLFNLFKRNNKEQQTTIINNTIKITKGKIVEVKTNNEQEINKLKNFINKMTDKARQKDFEIYELKRQLKMAQEEIKELKEKQADSEKLNIEIERNCENKLNVARREVCKYLDEVVQLKKDNEILKKNNERKENLIQKYYNRVSELEVQKTKEKEVIAFVPKKSKINWTDINKRLEALTNAEANKKDNIKDESEYADFFWIDDIDL